MAWTPAELSALRETESITAFLVELDWPDGLVNLWTGTGDLVFDGKNWLGLGIAELGVGQIEQTVANRDSNGTLTLFGLSDPTEAFDRAWSDLVNAAMAADVAGRPLTIWQTLWADEGKTLIGGPRIIERGQMEDIFPADDGERELITVSYRQLGKIRTRRQRFALTPETQAQFYPDDTGMEWQPSVGQKGIVVKFTE